MHTAIQTINFAAFVIKTVTIKLYSLVAESSKINQPFVYLLYIVYCYYK